MNGYTKEKGVNQLMYCRGIRGATTVEHNSREEILAATTELLQLLISRNELRAEDVASVIFTVTEDLDAEFPALAARYLGWTEVALMCTREIPVPGSLGKCIRILLHVNTTRSAAEIQHVYIRGAVNLRPTLNENR
jgi:chorismate mutase